MNKYFSLFIVSIFISLTACVDRQFDEPEFPFEDPDLEATTSIAALKSTHVNGQYETLTDGAIIAGVVVGNDKSGNFYETIVIADETGGIEVKIDKRSLFNTYPVGRKVFIKTQGLVMGDYNDLVQLGFSSNDNAFIGIPGEYVEEYVIGGSLNNSFQVDTLSIKDLDENYVSMLVVLKDVQFIEEELGSTYADGQYKVTTNRTLEDCSDRQVLVRTSGYASFASIGLPEGKGTFAAVVSRYRDDIQLYLRDITDVDMNGERCKGDDPGEISFDKDFEDGKIFTGGWTTQSAVGTVKWVASEFGGRKFAKASNYNGNSNSASDTWLISPKTNLGSFDKPALQFENAASYSGPDMEVYISSSYDGISVPDIADWTKLSYSKSNGFFEWTNSGEIDLSSFSGEVYIGFRYLGTDSSGKTWEVDDILMKEYGGSTGGDPEFDKDFEDGEINSGGWITKLLIGNSDWEAYEFSGERFARITNFNGASNSQSDAWLISPEIDLSTFDEPALNFRTACNYSGPELEIYVSTSYDGSALPEPSLWTELAAPISSGDWEWVESGDIDLSAYQSQTVHVAFRYLGSDSNGKTWEVDDIKMVEGSGGTGGVTNFEDGFENGLAKWTTYNVLGAQEWEHSTQYGNPGDCARVSGYDGSSFANEDWLISPAIDLDNASSANLEFESAMNYSGNPMEVFLSDEYSGSGDPNDVNWEKINPSLSNGSWEWVSSGSIDLSEYLGTNVYFAFKFTSTDQESSTWEIDNVKVTVD